jgi:hypothetical protein
MKNSLGVLLMLAVTTLTLSGCGKDNSTGKGGVYRSPYSGTIPAGSQTAFANAQAWYSSTVEGLPNSPGARTEQRRVDVYKDGNGCKTKTLLGFFDVNFCFNNTSPESSNTVSRVVYVILNQAKSNNPKLAAVFAPPANFQLVNATQSSGFFGKNIYTIEYANPGTGHSIRYMIDSGLNSAFNPVDIYDTATRSREYVINQQQLAY